MSHSLGWQVSLQAFFSRHLTPPTVHSLLYRLSGGLLGSRLPGVKPRVLLLTVAGRRSGAIRNTPLVYFQFGERYAIAGTNNGADRHPAWYWNLRSNPEVEVQIGSTSRRVHARVVDGPERAQLWERMIAIHPLFVAYQQRTSREIPVIILEPAN